MEKSNCNVLQHFYYIYHSQTLLVFLLIHTCVSHELSINENSSKSSTFWSITASGIYSHLFPTLWKKTFPATKMIICLNLKLLILQYMLIIWNSLKTIHQCKELSHALKNTLTSYVTNVTNYVTNVTLIYYVHDV